MNYKYIGKMIKDERINQNMSQASLCVGICSVSYLSKIENGNAKSSDEVINLLLDELELSLPKEIANQEDIFRSINSFYRYQEFCEFDLAIDQIRSLSVHNEVLLNSVLRIDWLIVKYISMLSVDDNVDYFDVKIVINELDEHSSLMDGYQLCRFYYLKGIYYFNQRDYIEAIKYYKMAYAIEEMSYIYVQICNSYYVLGQYHKVIDKGKRIFQLLMNHGNLRLGYDLTLLLAA